MRKTEDWLKELPAPLNEWALSQVNKSWEGWRDECFSLQKAIICFAEWHKTKQGWRYWYDVAFNELHEHPDVVAYKERPKLNPEYHDEGKRKTLTNQEKYLQMEGKQEKQFPYKATYNGNEVEVIAEYDGKAWFRDTLENYWVRLVQDLRPLPEKPLMFGEWCAENKLDDISSAAAFFDSGIEKRFQEAYDQYQDYLKTFEG